MQTNNKKPKYKQKTIENIIFFYNDFRHHLLNNNGQIPSVKLFELYTKYSLPTTTLKCFVKHEYVTKIAPSHYDYNPSFLSISEADAIKVLASVNKLQRNYMKKYKKRKQEKTIKASKPVKVRTEPRQYKKKKPSIFRRFLNFIFGK
jgi:hypothetical protein